jgi:hypothetical protein
MGMELGVIFQSKTDFDLLFDTYILSSLDFIGWSSIITLYVNSLALGYECLHWSCTPVLSLNSLKAVTAP